MHNGNDNFDDFFKKEDERVAQEQRERLEKLSQQTRSGYNEFGQPYAQTPNSFAGYGPLPTSNYGNMNYGDVHQRTSRKKRTILIVAAALLMVVVFFLGMLVQDFTAGDRKLLDDVIRLINNEAFVQDSDDPYAHDIYYQAAKAMLESIDPFSTLLTPQELYDFLNQPELSEPAHGISYTRNSVDYEYEIFDAQIGGPAYKAGVLSEDRIVGIGVWKSNTAPAITPVDYKTTVDDFLELIRNDKITLQVKRESEALPINFTLERAIYQSSDVDYYFGENNNGYSVLVYDKSGKILAEDGQAYLNSSGQPREGVKPKRQNYAMPDAHISRNNLSRLNNTETGYIRLTSFMESEQWNGPDVQLIAALDKFKESGKSKLILDLRSNGGGSVSICENITQYLIYDKSNPGNKNLIMTWNKNPRTGLNKSNKTANIFYQNYFKTDASAPQIVVLTNENTASASEALLGSMLHYGTAVQIGKRTYGKGIAQTVIGVGPSELMPDNQYYPYGAYMTVYQFFAPCGVYSPQGKGYPKEDFAVGNYQENYKQQTARAIDYLLS